MDMQGFFGENFHVINALSPSADRGNTSPVTDVINMANYQKCVFIVQEIANVTSTAGTFSMKPQSVDNVTSSNATDLPFYYSKKTTGASSVWGAWTAVAAGASVSITANEDTIWQIEVNSRDLPATQKYIQLKLTEVVNAPVVAGVIAILTKPRYGYPFNIDPLA